MSEQPKRVRFTARELETLLAVVGDALAEETLSNPDDEAEYERDIAAFYSGMEKLKTLLARAR